MDRTQEFLKELVEADGAPGFESQVAAVLQRNLQGVGAISRDRLGSFICEKKGASPAPKIMLAGQAFVPLAGLDSLLEDGRGLRHQR